MEAHGISKTELENLKLNISKLMSMSPAQVDIFLSGMHIRSYNKGDSILNAGETEKYLSIVVSGLTRHYIIKDGVDLSFDFSFQNEFNSSYASFIRSRPSQFFIEALEPTVLASFSFDFLQHLYQNFPESNVFGRIVVEDYFVYREQRELSLLTENATERYKKLLKNNSVYVKQIPLKYLATYLNITPESLSRIRKQIDF